MNRDKFYANEKKQEIYYRRGGICEVCGRPIPFHEAQLAHRIAKTKGNLKKYGKEVIHSVGNLKLVCSSKCNDAVNIGFRPKEVESLVAEILESLKQ